MTDDGDGQLVGTAGTTLVVPEPVVAAAGPTPATSPDPTTVIDPVVTDGASAPEVASDTERDEDGDRVTDDVDSTSEHWLMPSARGGVPLQTRPEHRLVLGAAALAAGRDAPRLEAGDLRVAHGVGDGASAVSDDILHDAGVFDIEVHGLEGGGTASLVIPVDGAIPADATLRLLSAAAGWRDFATTSGDGLGSTLGSSLACPGVTDTSYAPGLGNGDHCLRLDVVDGGPNDADGRADGAVRLTSALAIAARPPSHRDPRGGSADHPR